MNLKPLYDVKLIEANRQHYYQIGSNEDWRPGVTTVLGVMNKPALIGWAAKSVSDNIREELLKYPDTVLSKKQIESICDEGKNIYKKKAQDAADIGTRVHKAVDAIIRGEKPTITDDIRDGVQGFVDWQAAHSFTIHAGDTKLGSRLFGYGGSLDFVGIDSKGLAVIWDLKTTKKRKDRDHGIYPEYGLQLAAYAKAFTETYGIEVGAVYALWVNKEKPEFKAVKVSNINVAFEGFLACLKIYQTQKFELFEDQLSVA